MAEPQGPLSPHVSTPTWNPLGVLGAFTFSASPGGWASPLPVGGTLPAHIWVLFSWAQWALGHLLNPVTRAGVRAPQAGPWFPYLLSLIVFSATVGLGRTSGPGPVPRGSSCREGVGVLGTPAVVHLDTTKLSLPGRGLSCVAAELNETVVTWPGIGQGVEPVLGRRGQW